MMRDICKSYGEGTSSETSVLHSVDFVARRGEFVSIVGSSGSGKSTLMNIMGLLDSATSGSYRLNGVKVSNLSSDYQAKIRREEIGFVFQSFNLVSTMTALQNVALPMMYAGFDRSERNERARGLLAIVGMEHREGYYPRELSGGQQQRVAIARSLANDPGIILADEPTGALDVRTARSVLEIFRTISEKIEKTIVLITHDLSISKQTDRQVVLANGVIQSQGFSVGEC